MRSTPGVVLMKLLGVNLLTIFEKLEYFTCQNFFYQCFQKI